MNAGLRRALAALSSGTLAGICAGFAHGLTAPAGTRLALGWRVAGLLCLPGALVGLCALPIAAAATPSALERLRRATAARAATLRATLVLTPPAAVVWCALAAALARRSMTECRDVGLCALGQSVALAGVSLATALALALGRRLVVRALGRWPAPGPGSLLEALAAGLLAAAALVAWGAHRGDPDGRGGGLLGAFGVLARPGLDATPALTLAAIAAGAALLGRLVRRAVLVALPLSAAAAGLLLWADARHFGDAPAAAALAARHGLARHVLLAARAASDRDRDGHAGLFGGGDCDDADPARHPGARRVPGNGIDEDCSGRGDAPPRARATATAAAARPTPTPAVARAPDAPRAGASPLPRLLAETPADMNLVVLTVDSLRWDLHYAGNPREITPNLDRLAAQGVVFDRGYALSSYTGRSLGPMMTGRYPTECVRDRRHFIRYFPENVFLAERLRAHGFRTLGASAHGYLRAYYGFDQGMDEWDLSAHPHRGSDSVSTDAQLADRAIAMLQRPELAAGRFFLWVHFMDPHTEYLDHPELPLLSPGDRGQYEREVMFTDRQIGRVLAALDALPFARRTIVVLTADHGEAFGEHGMVRHGIELWEVLVRVPWIFRVPGVAPRHVAVPRSHVDLVPTLLELLRLPVPPREAPDGLSGESLVADLFGAPAPPRPIYLELPRGSRNSLRRSVLFDGWKLTERYGERFELYHLDADPDERTDLAATDRAALRRMRALMDRVRAALRPGREVLEAD